MPVAPDLTSAERDALFGSWPVYLPRPAGARYVDTGALEALEKRGLAYERRNFGKTEWRLTPRGRALRATLLDLCTTCEQPLKGRCHSWCPEGARRAESA